MDDSDDAFDRVAVGAAPGNWYLLGVPFLIKTRRMLDGMDTGKTTNTHTFALLFRAGAPLSVDGVALRVVA